jgi:hypothetical protein
VKDQDPSVPDRYEVVAHGVTAAVYERPRPIPARLELLLQGGEGWRPLRVISRRPLYLGGAAMSCATDDHRMRDWLEGFHTGSDAIVRHLKLLACADCGAVCVRDASVDNLPGLRPGRLAPRRRDRVIGWYTGSRPRQRVYT